MCGQFTQCFPWREMHAYLSLIGPATNLRLRHSLAPSQSAAVVPSDADGRRLSMLRWGLIPAWAKEPQIGIPVVLV